MFEKVVVAEGAPQRGKTMDALRENRRHWFGRKWVSLALARRSKPRKSAMNTVSEPRAGTEAESFIVGLLQAKGEVPYTEVVEGLTEFLYERELAAGAAMVDIGLWGKALFVSEARRELELGKGKFRELDFSGRKPDELLSNLSRHGAAALPGDRRGSGGGAQDRQPAGSRRGGDSA
ncbi:MAG: hypothetical protein ACM3SP_24600 [Chloroflexota bacterium]